MNKEKNDSGMIQFRRATTVQRSAMALLLTVGFTASTVSVLAVDDSLLPACTPAALSNLARSTKETAVARQINNQEIGQNEAQRILALIGGGDVSKESLILAQLQQNMKMDVQIESGTFEKGIDQIAKTSQANAALVQLLTRVATDIGAIGETGPVGKVLGLIPGMKNKVARATLSKDSLDASVGRIQTAVDVQVGNTASAQKMLHEISREWRLKADNLADGIEAMNEAYKVLEAEAAAIPSSSPQAMMMEQVLNKLREGIEDASEQELSFRNMEQRAGLVRQQSVQAVSAARKVPNQLFDVKLNFAVAEASGKVSELVDSLKQISHLTGETNRTIALKIESDTKAILQLQKEGVHGTKGAIAAAASAERTAKMLAENERDRKKNFEARMKPLRAAIEKRRAEQAKSDAVAIAGLSIDADMKKLESQE